MSNIIATNLKNLREAARYTQDEVAQTLGITRSAYSNYVSGERQAPYDVLEKVSDLFGCDMCVLFEANENADAMVLASAFRIDGLILPLYGDFGAAHQRNHVDMVIVQSMAIASDLDVDMYMRSEKGKMIGNWNDYGRLLDY